ncbi:hypothetical protein Tco_0786431 [Tanacetum coccineum]
MSRLEMSRGVDECPFIPMIAGQRKPEGQWTSDERKAANLDQRLKSLIINTNHVKDSELASPFGKLKYEENLIDSIYETEKDKSLVSATPLSTTFFSTSIIQEFQDSPDDEEDTRSSQKYLNDLEEEYQAKALLAKSKRFFKKGTQRFSSAKATDQTECHKYGRKGHIHKPELRPTKDIKSKYNNVKAKLALLSSSALASKASMVKNKGLIAQAYEWDEEEVSSNDNEMVEVKLLMALAEDNEAVKKKEQRNNLMSKHKDLVQELNTCKEQLLVLKQAKLDFLTMQHVNTEILKENQNLRKELKELTAITKTWLNISNKVNHYINAQIPTQKKRNLGVDQLTEDPSSSGQKTYTTLPSLKKLASAEPVFEPKTIKSILKINSTFKAEALKGVTINEPSSTPAKGNKSASASKVNLAPTGGFFFKILNPKDHSMTRLLYAYTIGSFFLEEESSQKNTQHVKKSYETCGSTVHTTTYHNDIEWFKRAKALQDKKVEALKSTKAESSDANKSKTPTKSVKSYLHKYVEPGPNVVFGDDSTCTTEGYGSIKCMVHTLVDAKYIVQFDEKRGTIFNSNKEVVMIAPRIIDISNDRYLYPYEPSQMYQTNSNEVSFIEPYESHEPVVLETKVSSDQNGQADQNDLNDQNDQSDQTDEILNDDQSENPNHTNDE